MIIKSIQLFSVLFISTFVFGQGKTNKKLPTGTDSLYLSNFEFHEYMDSFRREIIQKFETIKPESNKEIKELKSQIKTLSTGNKELKEQNDSLIIALKNKKDKLFESENQLNDKTKELKKLEEEKRTLITEKNTFFDKYKIPFDSLVNKYSEGQIREVSVQMNNLKFNDDSLNSNLKIALKFWEYQKLLNEKFQATQITNAITALDKKLNHEYARNSMECAILSEKLKSYESSRLAILNHLNFIDNVYKESVNNDIDEQLNKMTAISYLIKSYKSGNKIAQIPYLDALLKEQIIRFAQEKPNSNLVNQFRDKL